MKSITRLTDMAKTAQLTKDECALFYETWFGLISFINEQKKVLGTPIEPVYPNFTDEVKLFKVRQVLWENPQLIDEYLAGAELTGEKVELLQSWRDHHQKGEFFLVDYRPEYAVALGSDEAGKDKLYGITGISQPLSEVMQRKLPVPFEAVLLPFKDKIIYDSFLGSLRLGFGDGARGMFQDLYQKALECGITTRLG